MVEIRNDLLKKYNLGSLQIRPPDKKPTDDHMICDAKAILMKEDEMLEKYIDEAGTDGLDREALLRFGKKITIEKKEI